MTQILKVITEYCQQYVDDINLSELAAIDAPLFARRMWQLLLPAISRFKIPEEMPEYLFGTPDNERLVYPQYDDTVYTVTEEQTSDFTIELGDDYKGYEVAACRIRSYDKAGNVVLTPIAISYDTESGDVVIPASEEAPIVENTILTFDFYKDGYFVENLSHPIMDILGKCFAVQWQERFNTDWLSMVSKVEDKSFFEQNRANKINADTERKAALERELAGQMRAFSKNRYYMQTIAAGRRLNNI